MNNKKAETGNYAHINFRTRLFQVNIKNSDTQYGGIVRTKDHGILVEEEPTFRFNIRMLSGKELTTPSELREFLEDCSEEPMSVIITARPKELRVDDKLSGTFLSPDMLARIRKQNK